MKKEALLSLVTVALLTAAAPLSGQAQDHGAITPPSDEVPYRYHRGGSYSEGWGEPPTIAERIEDLRYDYDGQRIRFRLASALAAQETAIGIRADQKDAWRAYTQALLALIPDRDMVVSLVGAPEEGPKGPPAFGRAEALAEILAGYADKAQTLKKAIDDLRAKLTPEQRDAARVPRLVRG